jgi:hypothetical protein
MNGVAVPKATQGNANGSVTLTTAKPPSIEILVLSLNANANVFDDIGGWVKGAADDTGDWFEGAYNDVSYFAGHSQTYSTCH